MKNQAFFFLVSVVLLASCQNPKVETTNETVNESELNGQESSPITVIYDYPNSHSFREDVSQISADTALLITVESIDSLYIERNFKSSEDTTVNVRYHDFLVHLKLAVKEEIVFERTLDKSYFSESMDKEFQTIGLMQSVWFDSISDAGEIVLNLTICERETDYCYFYHLFIDRDLKLRYELVEIT